MIVTEFLYTDSSKNMYCPSLFDKLIQPLTKKPSVAYTQTSRTMASKDKFHEQNKVSESAKRRRRSLSWLVRPDSWQGTILI